MLSLSVAYAPTVLPHTAAWIEELAKQRDDEVEVVDLKQYPLSFFAEPASPLFARSQKTAKRWQKKMGAFDANIFTAAEYNHGATAVLKNAWTTPTPSGSSRSILSRRAARFCRRNNRRSPGSAKRCKRKPPISPTLTYFGH
ncbi:MAG: NADPH-dependent FMN reductase [Xanthobacteraceae bacterium]